ncbi:endonuclease III [Spirochaetota bacterium]
MNKALSNKIIKGLSAYYKDVKPGLNFKGLYELTISVVLSAQTTDKQVNSVTKELFSLYPNFKSLSSAKTRDIENIIKRIGFFRNKSKNIINLSKMIIESFNGKVPGELNELVKLPGVGRKSANVILSSGFNKPAFAVDTHVARIARRLAYINSKNPYDIEMALTNLIPEEKWNEGHLLFIKHGRKFCKARNPLCKDCPIINLCSSSDKRL